MLANNPYSEEFCYEPQQEKEELKKFESDILGKKLEKLTALVAKSTARCEKTAEYHDRLNRFKLGFLANYEGTINDSYNSTSAAATATVAATANLTRIVSFAPQKKSKLEDTSRLEEFSLSDKDIAIISQTVNG